MTAGHEDVVDRLTVALGVMTAGDGPIQRRFADGWEQLEDLTPADFPEPDTGRRWTTIREIVDLTRTGHGASTARDDAAQLICSLYDLLGAVVTLQLDQHTGTGPRPTSTACESSDTSTGKPAMGAPPRHSSKGSDGVGDEPCVDTKPQRA